jgi:hypothetical protein
MIRLLLRMDVEKLRLLLLSDRIAIASNRYTMYRFDLALLELGAAPRVKAATPGCCHRRWPARLGAIVR